MTSDFSQFMPGGSPYLLAGNRHEQAPQLAWLYNLQEKDVPPGFPMTQWGDQQARYRVYWEWFNGDVLSETRSNPDTGETEVKFPLQVNVARKICRNHASLLFGEAPDAPIPLVLTSAQPRDPLNGDEPEEADIKSAIGYSNVVNEVWEQSGGRAQMQEAGTLTQFLGGHAFQLIYDPEWNEGVVPNLYVRSWPADFFLPVWSASNRHELLEAYVVCRIGGRQAKMQYGYEGGANLVTYVEHWTKTNYSAYLDGQPVTGNVLGEKVIFLNRPNIFGKVPFVYIPHLREGSFFGSSHIPDIHGLVREYNERMADLADAIDQTLDRVIWVKNTQNIERTVLPNGEEAFNLGLLAPGYNKDADAWINEPPNFSAGLTDFPEKQLYQQIRRVTFNPPIADGEDEGSQRSGVTLDIRFWPATSHARAERVFWEAGLNDMARLILLAVNILDLWSDLGLSAPPRGFLNKLRFAQQWHPQIPRDREAMINESTVRLAAGTMSPHTFNRRMADVVNSKQEVEEGIAFLKEVALAQGAAKMELDQAAMQDSSFAKGQQKINRS